MEWQTRRGREVLFDLLGRGGGYGARARVRPGLNEEQMRNEILSGGTRSLMARAEGDFPEVARRSKRDGVGTEIWTLRLKGK